MARPDRPEEREGKNGGGNRSGNRIDKERKRCGISAARRVEPEGRSGNAATGKAVPAGTAASCLAAAFPLLARPQQGEPL